VVRRPGRLILLTLFTTAWRLHPSDELLTSS